MEVDTETTLYPPLLLVAKCGSMFSEFSQGRVLARECRDITTQRGSGDKRTQSLVVSLRVQIYGDELVFFSKNGGWGFYNEL